MRIGGQHLALLPKLLDQRTQCRPVHLLILRQLKYAGA